MTAARKAAVMLILKSKLRLMLRLILRLVLRLMLRPMIFQRNNAYRHNQ